MSSETCGICKLAVCIGGRHEFFSVLAPYLQDSTTASCNGSAWNRPEEEAATRQFRYQTKKHEVYKPIVTPLKQLLPQEGDRKA